MDCYEKEFGWLQKNVGGHFPCLFYGLDVKLAKVAKDVQKSWKVLVKQFENQQYVKYSVIFRVLLIL